MRLAPQPIPQAGPAVQGQLVGTAVAQRIRQQDFLVVAITGGRGTAAHVQQRFGMAKVTRIPQRQVQRHRRISGRSSGTVNVVRSTKLVTQWPQ